MRVRALIEMDACSECHVNHGHTEVGSMLHFSTYKKLFRECKKQTTFMHANKDFSFWHPEFFFRKTPKLMLHCHLDQFGLVQALKCHVFLWGIVARGRPVLQIPTLLHSWPTPDG